MPVEDAYTPITALLTDDSDADGIRSIVNGAVPSLLDAGSVFVSRERNSASTRGGKTRPASVLVVPQAPAPPEEVGTGWDRHEEVFDLEVSLKTKALPEGASPLATLDSAVNALVEHYHARNAFTLAGLTQLIAISAERVEVDENFESSEVFRGVVRTSWAYLQQRELNA